MDVQMPELDGVGATREIRSLPQPKCAIPIIALTANAMAGAEAEYLKAGMDDYVSKPVRAEVLLAKLARFTAAISRREPCTPIESHALEPSPLDMAPAFDTGPLAGLTAMLPSASLRQFVDLYLKDATAHLAHLDELRAALDLDGLAREAHDIAGTAGNFGATQVSALARQLEAACRHGDREAAAALVDALTAASVAASAAIRDWLESRQNSDKASRKTG
jgi:CheY-like chemotaxis protein